MEEKLSRYQKYYRRNRELLNKKAREYYRNNRDKIRAKQAEYYRQTSEGRKEVMREYYRNNYEAVRKKQHEYYEKYKDIINSRSHRRIMADPHARVVKNLRSRLGAIIKGRSKKTMELIGCDREHLMRHLEVQFEEGMSWDNYGKWSIDHHIPIYAFDPDNKKEVEACWHFSNLRPMWAKRNISKGKKICLER